MKTKVFIGLAFTTIVGSIFLCTNSIGKSVGSELAELYKQDQFDRSATKADPIGKPKEWALIKKKDEKRRSRVLELLKNDKLKTKEDYYHAAMVLQHGDKSSDYILAHVLSTTAAIKGHRKAAWLCAASFDRLMGSTNEPQIFGTQFYKEGNKPTVLAKPINLELIPDSIREVFNVPAKKEAFKRLEFLNSAKPNDVKI